MTAAGQNKNKRAQIQGAIDPIFHTIFLQRFINIFSCAGQKDTVYRIFQQLLKLLKYRYGLQGSLLLFELFISNRTLIITKTRKRSKNVFEVPTLIIGVQRYLVTARRFLKYVNMRHELRIFERLYNEILDIYIYHRSQYIRSSSDIITRTIASKVYKKYRW